MEVEDDSVIGVLSLPLVIQMVEEEVDISIRVSQMLHLLQRQLLIQKLPQRKLIQIILQAQVSEKILVMEVVVMVLLSSLSVDQSQQQLVIIMVHVIPMNRVIVLIVMIKLTTVLSMHKENNSSVPKIRWRNVTLINSHTVSQHVSMGILVTRVDNV